MMTTLAILTKNRAAPFRRCLLSLRDNARSFGRDTRFVVADDSDDPAENRRALEESGVDFWHLDRGARGALAQALAAESGCPEEVARFAVLPGDDVAMGAARNTLLLALTGRRFVMVDDDMACKFAPVPGASDDIVTAPTGSRRKQTCWIIDGVDEGALLDEDFMSKHEALLGPRPR